VRRLADMGAPVAPDRIVSAPRATALFLRQHHPEVRRVLTVNGLDRLIPWTEAARLVEEAGGPAELLLLEKGNHGCANLSPFHRYRTADWVAGQLGARTRRPAGAAA